MERIGLSSYSAQQVPMQLIGTLTRPARGDRERFARDLADELGASELLVLTTCNRVEVLFRRDTGPLPGHVDARAIWRALRAETGPQTPPDSSGSFLAGRAAIRHLFRVACSLDSLVVGESEILRQVRAAFDEHERLGLIGPRLRELGAQAIEIGKRSRAHTSLGDDSTSVVALGVSALLKQLSKPPERARAAVLGAGETGRLAARTLRARGVQVVWIANRSLPAAEELAAELGAEARPLSRFRCELPSVDVLVSATGSSGYVLDASELRGLARHRSEGAPLLALDLAMPPDLEPVDDPSVRVVALSSLREQANENRIRRSTAAAEVERFVDEKVTRCATRLSERRVSSVLHELRVESTELFEAELRELLERHLLHLDDAERRAIDHWARRTFGRLAHLPFSALRSLVHSDPEYLNFAEEDTVG